MKSDKKELYQNRSQVDQKATARAAALPKGTEAPDFTLHSTPDQLVSLSDLRRKRLGRRASSGKCTTCYSRIRTRSRTRTCWSKPPRSASTSSHSPATSPGIPMPPGCVTIS
jgi:hypothetical protein